MRPALPRPLLASAALAAVLLSGCASGEPAPDTAPAEETTRTIETTAGDVDVPAEPTRVVLLNYALAGYLYDLDAPVVAMTPEVVDGGEEFAEFWVDDAEAAGTEFLPWNADGFNLERIAAFEPDLIIGGGLGFPLFQAMEQYEGLSAIAPTALVSGDAATWQDQFAFLAEEVFDRPDVFDEAVRTHAARVDEVAAAITPPPGPSAYLTLDASSTPFVLIEDLGLPTELAEVGIEPAPLFADGGFEPYTAGGDMFEVSEELIGSTLDVPSLFVMGFNGADIDVDALADGPPYGGLPAFEAGEVYELPYWAIRGDYDEAMAVLDLVEGWFG